MAKIGSSRRLALAVAVALPVAAQARAAPAHFDPLAFFAGETEGSGRLKVLFSHSRAVHVSGHGTRIDDATLVLVQTVATQGKPETRRQWRMRRVAPDRYAGTLTDASGPVAMTVSGNHLVIRYRARGGLAFRQDIALEPGGKVAHNVMRVRKFGVVVATLRETIRRRADPG